MTNTQRAIAALYYRLVYVQRIMTVDEVPVTYRGWLEEYRREIEN